MTRWLALLAVAGAAGLAVVLLIGGDEGENPAELATLPALDALGPVPADAYWVSPEGSDSDPGTKAAPWQSIGMALETAQAGDTVVLAPGTYGERGSTIEFSTSGEDGAPIVFRGDPEQERPQLLGAVRVRADHLRLGHLLLDGPTGPVQEPSEENPSGEQVQLSLDNEGETVEDIGIFDSEIRGSDWHAGIFLTHAEDIQIAGNYIHHNGDETDPGQANLSHGIYWASGSGVIVNNVVEGNVARGVQLFPEPSGVSVIHNTIVGNGAAGVQVAKYSEGNLIANNIVAFNGDAGIRSDSLARGDNLATTNLLWENAGTAEEDGEFLVIADSLNADPAFAGEGDYELTEGSAAVDAADPERSVDADYLGRGRPRGEGPDLGAFESW